MEKRVISKETGLVVCFKSYTLVKRKFYITVVKSLYF